jgi:prevent-host-death family protein
MKRVKVGDFRDRASELIRRAEHGETILIANRDRDVAKIVPITTPVRQEGGLVGLPSGSFSAARWLGRPKDQLFLATHKDALERLLKKPDVR